MNRSAKDRGLTFLARKLAYHNVTLFTAIILKEHRVLLQQDNQQSDDSQQMECEVLTDSGQTVYTAVDIVTQKQHMVQCEVRIDS